MVRGVSGQSYLTADVTVAGGLGALCTLAVFSVTKAVEVKYSSA